jgi:hypothetical protein
MQLLLEHHVFYVYIYLNPLKSGDFYYKNYHFNFSPFYVGKGQGKRLYKHLTEADKLLQIEKESINNEKETYNMHKINTINKIKRLGKEPIIFKIKENLSNEESCELEKYLIKLIGRADKKLGPLTNQTDGGEGSTGYKHSTKTKLKMRLNINYELIKYLYFEQFWLLDDICDHLKINIGSFKSRLKQDDKIFFDILKFNNLRKGIKTTQSKLKGRKGNPSPLKGKTYEEFFGEEEAMRKKEIISKNSKKRLNIKYKFTEEQRKNKSKNSKIGAIKRWKNKRDFTEKNKNIIISLYKSYNTIENISNILNITENQIYTVLKTYISKEEFWTIHTHILSKIKSKSNDNVFNFRLNFLNWARNRENFTKKEIQEYFNIPLYIIKNYFKDYFKNQIEIIGKKSRQYLYIIKK